jgi:hypothetical protein
MPTTARALVIKPTIDVKRLLKIVDRTVEDIDNVLNTGAIWNNAVSFRSGKQVLIFPFLDKGTRPHWIDTQEDDGLLANQASDFGPVYGPIFHPGTPPHDISTRVGAHFEHMLEVMFDDPSLDALEEIPTQRFNFIVKQALLESIDFAIQITPDNWPKVKASYAAYAGGRRVL